MLFLGNPLEDLAGNQRSDFGRFIAIDTRHPIDFFTAFHLVIRNVVSAAFVS